jgi:hypothetical protein
MMVRTIIPLKWRSNQEQVVFDSRSISESAALFAAAFDGPQKWAMTASFNVMPMDNTHLKK